jgi:hypothetical protein
MDGQGRPGPEFAQDRLCQHLGQHIEKRSNCLRGRTSRGWPARGACLAAAAHVPAPATGRGRTFGKRESLRPTPDRTKWSGSCGRRPVAWSAEAIQPPSPTDRPLFDVIKGWHRAVLRLKLQAGSLRGPKASRAIEPVQLHRAPRRTSGPEGIFPPRVLLN